MTGGRNTYFSVLHGGLLFFYPLSHCCYFRHTMSNVLTLRYLRQNIFVLLHVPMITGYFICQLYSRDVGDGGSKNCFPSQSLCSLVSCFYTVTSCSKCLQFVCCLSVWTQELCSVCVCVCVVIIVIKMQAEQVNWLSPN